MNQRSPLQSDETDYTRVIRGTSAVNPRAVDPEGWRDLMPQARAAAGRLAAAGSVEVSQGGEVVDVAAARGPVRVRRPRYP